MNSVHIRLKKTYLGCTGAHYRLVFISETELQNLPNPKAKMNKINRKVEYALMALKHMRAKSPGELTSAKEICDSYGAPFDGMSRVLQVLAQKGVLKSEQGAQGGYQITRDLAKVSLQDLVEWMTGKIEIAKCMHTGAENSCEIRSSCNIVSPMMVLNKKLNEFYKTLSVAELLDPKSKTRAEGLEIGH
jgi:Rrf2 family transcriptional regulator, nitric oxide-sensitive transcriptional repressor